MFMMPTMQAPPAQGKGDAAIAILILMMVIAAVIPIVLMYTNPCTIHGVMPDMHDWVVKFTRKNNVKNSKICKDSKYNVSDDFVKTDNVNITDLPSDVVEVQKDAEFRLECAQKCHETDKCVAWRFNEDDECFLYTVEDGDWVPVAFNAADGTATGDTIYIRQYDDIPEGYHRKTVMVAATTAFTEDCETAKSSTPFYRYEDKCTSDEITPADTGTSIYHYEKKV